MWKALHRVFLHTGTEGVDIKITNMGAESVGESAASTFKQTTLKRKHWKITIDQCFERVGSKGRKKFRCNICFKHPDVVKLRNKSDQAPQSAQRSAVKSGLNILKII